MKKTKPKPAAPRPVATEPGPSGPPAPVRAVFAVVGLALLFVAQYANYTEEYIFAAGGRVHFRTPGMGATEYNYISIWLLVAGLPLLVLAASLLWPRFRRALGAPWRDAKVAIPLVAVLVYLALGIVPWDPASPKPQDSGSHMVFIFLVGAAGLAFLLLGAYRQLSFLDRTLRRLGGWLLSLPRWSFVALAAGTMFAVANAISWGIFEHIPHIQDSIAQVFQARIFATGRIFLPAPAFPDFFDYTHIINVGAQTGHPATGFEVAGWPGPLGRWYSQYTFMHPLVLLPFVRLGIPWLANPLLGALTVGATYFLGRELYDETTARLGAGLMVASPFVFNMSAEFMNHSSALLFVTLFLLFYFRTLREAKLRQAIAAGACWGMAANVRGFSSVALGLPFVGYAVYRLVREPRRYLGCFAAMLVCAAAVTGLTAVYNQLANGHPFLFGYVVKWGKGHELGFGRAAWGGEHTPLKGLINTGHDQNLVNKFLFEWPLPALVPAGILFAAGTRDRRDWLLASVFLALAGAFFFYWFHNVCFGPRFLYESSACLVLLTARGLLSLPDLLRRTFAVEPAPGLAGRFWGRTLAVCFLFTLAGLVPLEAAYTKYGAVNGKIMRSVRRAGLSNALVFCGQYGGPFLANRLDLQGDVVYAQNYGVLNSALTIAYPGRSCWYASQDTLRRLDGVDWAGSRLAGALDDIGAGLGDSLLAGYRTLIWPFRDAPPPLDSAWLSTHLADYRELSREIFTGRHQLEDFLPALAVWVVRDGREHLKLFAYMDDLENFVASNYKFTLLHVSPDGTAAAYDVRLAEGTEATVPAATGTLPVR